MYIVENVPGMKKIPVVMEAMTKLPDYNVNVLCPVNALAWLPQNQDRLILIGTRKAFVVRHPENTTRKRLREIIKPDAQVTLRSTRGGISSHETHLKK